MVIRPDINDGNPWSEMDIADLKASVESGKSLGETCTFLCRSDFPEVAMKATELKLKWKTRIWKKQFRPARSARVERGVDHEGPTFCC